jgi:hypothetical protein
MSNLNLSPSQAPSLNLNSPLLPYQTIRDCLSLVTSSFQLLTYPNSKQLSLPANELLRLHLRLLWLLNLLFPEKFSQDDYREYLSVRKQLQFEGQAPLTLLRQPNSPKLDASQDSDPE